MGLIFNAAEHGLSYAQSPQALVFDDFVRVYFSTRKPDGSKFLSHVGYVDMDKNFNVIKVVGDGVIALGKKGTFDEHGIFPFSVARDNKRILAFTTGWTRRQSVSVDTAIGFAESHDGGHTFNKPFDGPVLSSSLNEPFLVADGFVKVFNNQFNMWYIYGTRWMLVNEQPERIYKIGYAKSTDGINWVKANQQIIADVIGKEECQALPTVYKQDGTYKMIFCYRHAAGFRTDKTKSYRLGYAEAKSPSEWVRKDSEIVFEGESDGWDSDMMCYPNVFEMNNKTYLLYNGNEFGKSGFGLAEIKQ
jgi:sucrose-6-phosphate hydrolase SacC (GH32 family)